ncbi:hypothetical protein [Kitasatospora sp. NPDC006786]|uniref:hypothetical protein n=1 Tax=unclassified Kitasatospora TaxID=2633591 RepID=UPI0033C91CDC
MTTTTGTGLFGPAPDPAPVGDESIEWALWSTGTGEQRPMPDHITALITAAQHTARTAQTTTDHPAGHAVVLHRGRVWSADAYAASGTVQPSLSWSARCSVCGAEFDEEYGYHRTVDAAVEQAVDGGWSEPGGGWLVCDEDDRAHHAARTGLSGTAPIVRIQEQETLPGIPADEPVHEWFGLSYAAYLVLPRTLLQSMPAAWQQRLVACLRDLDTAFAHVPQAEAYDVTPGTAHEVGDLTEAQLRAASIHTETGDDPDGEARYRDSEGRELERHDTVLLPGPDPVPHYNRGRTRLTPSS